jgi:Zn-dependent protease with chaperone function
MLSFELDPIIWGIAFVALVFLSKYAIDQMPSKFWIIGFLIISYFQGIIFAFTFHISSNFFGYFENLFVPIPVSVMFGIFYFLLFLSLLNIFFTTLHKSETQVEDLPDHGMRDYIANLWAMPPEQIKMISYDDGNCPNMQRQRVQGNLVIHIGKNFMKLVNKSELLFALSHEVAHFKGRNYKWIFGTVCFLYLIFTCIIGQFIVTMNALNMISFLIITFILFIVGLMILNYIRWHDEYSADYNGGEKLKDIRDFDSFFQIEALVQKDHGLLFDLVFFDHPSSSRRFNHIQKLKEKINQKFNR